jgi:electron transport complex protein RnfG
MSVNPPPASHAHPSSLRLIATLAGIAVLSGLLVATVDQVTLEPILQNKREALEAAVFTVLPEASTRRNFLLDENGLHPLPDDALAQANLFAGYNEGGELTGVAMEASARGYQDVVRILYGYQPDTHCISGITVLESSETPGLGDRVETDPAFLANFDCLVARLNDAGTGLEHAIVTVKHGEKEHPWQIDAISGATVTCNAIGTALDRSASRMLPLLHGREEILHQPPEPERSPAP